MQSMYIHLILSLLGVLPYHGMFCMFSDIAGQLYANGCIR